MKAIIFDVDDTLIEWKKEFIFALKDVLIELDYNLEEDLIWKISDTIDAYEKVADKLTKNGLLEYINNKCMLNLPLKFIDMLEIKQGECVYEDKSLVKVIEYLSKKYDLYAITNWFTKTQKIRLEKMGILKYFKEVYGGDINYYKPNVKAFDVILDKYDPKECISIGDSLENDVLLPISLGMNAIWKTKNISNKYKTFCNLGELMDIL